MIPRFASLQFRNFRLLSLGLLISHTGTWMAMVAIVVATAMASLGTGSIRQEA